MSFNETSLEDEPEEIGRPFSGVNAAEGPALPARQPGDLHGVAAGIVQLRDGPAGSSVGSMVNPAPRALTRS